MEVHKTALGMHPRLPDSDMHVVEDDFCRKKVLHTSNCMLLLEFYISHDTYMGLDDKI